MKEEIAKQLRALFRDYKEDYEKDGGWLPDNEVRFYKFMDWLLTGKIT